MKQIIVDLVAYREDRYFPDVVLSALGKWGGEYVESAASRIIGCLAWRRLSSKRHLFGKMDLPVDSDFTKMVKQWVTETPELAELFEVREDGIYLRDDLPSDEVDEIAAYAEQFAWRDVHVRPA